MKRVYICHDNITGLFSAVYDAWLDRNEESEAGIGFRGSLEQELFCEYKEVQETQEKALVVERLIKKNLGEKVYWDIYHAALADDIRKGTAILGTMLEARKIPDSTKIMNHLTCPYVGTVFELKRRVANEAHFFKEFIRFKELEEGVLFSKIKPKSQVLTCVAPHFSDRLPLENFMIYDETHKMFVVHERQKRWVLVSGLQLNMEKMERYSDSELEIQRLFKSFCKTISIKERESYERQRQHLPLWFRQNMVEFEQDSSDLRKYIGDLDD